jgi:hypothetical protein
MGEKLNRLLDWIIIIGTISILFIFLSCSTNESNEVTRVPTLELDGRLPMDSNGPSYVSGCGEINTTIAPIFSMRTDALMVDYVVNE